MAGDGLDEREDLVCLPAGLELAVEGVGEAVEVQGVVVQEEVVRVKDVALAETLEKLEDALNVELRVEKVVETAQLEVVEREVVDVAKIERAQAVDIVAAEKLLLEDLEAQGVEDILDVQAVEIKRVCVQVGKVQTVHVELVVQVQALTIVQVLPVQVVVDLGCDIGGVALSLLTRYIVSYSSLHPSIKAYTGAAKTLAAKAKMVIE